VIIRMGTDVTNTMPFPVLSVKLGNLSGANPLVVPFALTNLSNPKTNNTFYVMASVGICQNCNYVQADGAYFNGSITVSDYGIHSMIVMVQDHDHGDNWDAKEWKVSVLSPTNAAPIEIPIPPIPTNPPTVILAAPSNLTYSTVNGIQLNWIDNSTGEDRYEVEMTNKKNGPWPPFRKVATLPPNTHGYAYSFGDKNVNYQFRVRAAFGTNVSDYSNVVNFRYK